MAKKQSPPLTEDEIRSVYRNEFYRINDKRYFRHNCTGGYVCDKHTYKKNKPKNNQS